MNVEAQPVSKLGLPIHQELGSLTALASTLVSDYEKSYAYLYYL